MVRGEQIAFKPIQAQIKKTINSYVNSLDDYKNLREDYSPMHNSKAEEQLSDLLSWCFYHGYLASMPSGKKEFADEAPKNFTEAIKYLKEKTAIKKSASAQIEDLIKARAFWVTRLADLEAIKRVQNYLIKNIKDETSFKSFIKDLSEDELLKKAGWSDSNGWYWETVYRTNTISAYNFGRAKAIDEFKPEYLEFIGIEDSRQTSICAARSGTLLPKDDPFWQSNFPPLHFNCRSTVRSVYKEELEEEGLIPNSKAPKVETAGQKFGNFPTNATFQKVTDDLEVKSKKKKTVLDAEKYAIEKLGINAKYTGIDVEIAEQWNMGIEKSIKEFPELKNGLRFIGSAQERNKLIEEELMKEILPRKEKVLRTLGFYSSEEEIKREAYNYAKKQVKSKIPKISANTLAQSYSSVSVPSASGITINRKKATNYLTLLKGLERDTLSGWNPKGGNTIQYLVDHEIGHQIDYLLNLKNDAIIKELYSSMTKEEIRSELCGYASTNIQEFIAEAWGEFQNAPKPRNVAKKIGNRIKEVYDLWKKQK